MAGLPSRKGYGREDCTWIQFFLFLKDLGLNALGLEEEGLVL
jgi:hypothetical protein